MPTSEQKWICCQLGAREHYAVPRSLRRAGVLDHVVTDLWIPSSSPWQRLATRPFHERFHAELADADVRSFNLAAIVFEASRRATGVSKWELMRRRNEWFQDRVVRHLESLVARRPGVPHRLFSYSYTARRPFQFAKSQGWTTVLGQIDPGPPEERIVNGLSAEQPDLAGPWQPAPPEYWRAWRTELELADRVVVNSSWSRAAMIEEGVAEDRVRIVPTAYDPPDGSAAFDRQYPDRFTVDRPLRVLFLGQVCLRKGFAAVLDAMKLLQGTPVEFSIVGSRLMSIPDAALTNPQAKWADAVPHAATARYYRDADVFLFPTLSDGFGLTQLEAQAWKLPVIASEFCGEVVRDGENGLRLRRVTGEEIGRLILDLVAEPSRLREMSSRCRVGSEFSLGRIGAELIKVAS